MLIKCTECGLQVSDKAISCPHCGYPMKPEVVRKTYTKKRMRLPNGFGQISKIKNKNLRCPYRAMISVGKKADGTPIRKLLKPQSYFESYQDAYAALVEYSKNPYDLEDDILVSQLYEKWTDSYFKNLKSKSSERTVTSAWAYCNSVYNMRVKDLRARHIKGCMENGIAIIKGEERTPTAGVQSRIKSLFNLMLDYAVEYELVDRNYARTFNVSDDILDEKENAKRPHMTFTDEEIQKLWDNLYSIENIDIVLIQCYSGWRPQELGLITIENTDIKNWLFIGGMKTSAGIDRVVPIHPKIRELVKRRYDEAIELGSEYLFNCTDTKTHKSSWKLTYDKYRARFVKIRDRLELNEDHRAHDGRMHFITMAKKYNVDEYAVKYIVGHAINDVTEKVYTEREISWLVTEMKKIK